MFICRDNPVEFARDILGFVPYPEQEALLACEDRYVILNCHRQWGKSTVTAVRALHRAMTRAGQQIVILSPTMRQARLLANRCRELARGLEVKLGTDGTNPRSIVFPNGSVILPLPAHVDRLRGFTANLLIIDEAARVPDEVYAAATPMLAATDGDLWLLSTPRGRAGFFYEEWKQRDTAGRPWRRILGRVRSGERVTAEFLAIERRRKTAEQFAEEYECEFVSSSRQLFSDEWLERSFTTEFGAFDACSRVDLQYVKHRPAYYLGIDVGKVRDHAAMTLLEYRVIPTGKRDGSTYEALYRRELRVVLAERFRLGTRFGALVSRAATLTAHPHLAQHTQLLFDVNGQGAPVGELLRDARMPVNLIPVHSTAGGRMTVAGSQRNVPKADLVAALEILFERGHLRIAAELPQADLLREELRAFEKKPQRGGFSKFQAGTGHDDMVMSLALAAWWAWTNRRHLLAGPELKVLD